ncbi:guanylate kinase [Alicyclobacillus fastidiosus]|uniref:Guanylate kinase n=1 Tax=Alicyclobacillus fastidiosus TaxID=392011 RepID=A0ABY6ZKJ1_9BACL|nr:guanylate kinase [Alicyclobacillus fastidiosus]WAH42614.1 guanylate kinase [Alicyclobacillus fastidiosus]
MDRVQFHLDRLLFEKNMKIPDLVEKSGVNKNTLYAIKKNMISRVDLKVLQNICDALGCSLSELMSYVPQTLTSTREGVLFVLSGPSGAGKNTLINSLKQNYDLGLTFIPSFTTRAMRPGEVEGHPYFFVTLADFEQMAARGEFLEHEIIHGNYYGTHLKTYEKTLRDGKDVIKDIDVNGALNLKKTFPSNIVLIYVRPTVLNDLEGRLHGRGDADEDIRRRLERLKYEESLSDQFDFLIFNDDIPTATAELAQIIKTYTKRSDNHEPRGQNRVETAYAHKAK